MRSTGSWYDLRAADGHLWRARLKGKFKLEGRKVTNPIAVGDRVVWQEEDRTENSTKNIARHPIFELPTFKQNNSQFWIANTGFMPNFEKCKPPTYPYQDATFHILFFCAVIGRVSTVYFDDQKPHVHGTGVVHIAFGGGRFVRFGRSRFFGRYSDHGVRGWGFGTDYLWYYAHQKESIAR